MEGMVGKYRNPGYLPIDADCNADHIPNTVIITKRVYDILCNGVGIFDDTAVRTAHDRGDPLQNSVCHLYRLQFSADDWTYHGSKEKNLKKKCIKNSTLADTDRKENIGGFVRCRVDFERNS